jgi:hypothetical protein
MTNTLAPSAQLAHFAANLQFEDIPEAVVRRAEDLFLDWFGSALAGKVGRPVQTIESLAYDMGPHEGRAEILISRRKTSPLFAAMVNAASSHYAEQDDVHNGSVFHPGAVIFPAVLAVAQDRGASGKDLITAAVAGYEAGIRIGEFLGRSHYKVFHTTGKTGQPVTVYSPGSTCRQSIDEQPDKYFMIHADEHWMVGELKVRPTLDDVEITDDPTLDKYLSELPARIEQLAEESGNLPPHIRRPYLRVKYNAELHDAARRLEAACVDKVHLFLKETPKAKERLVVSAPTTNVEVLTPTSLLRLAVDPEEDPRLFSVVSRFLAATNVDAELEALRQEWLRRDDVHQEIDSVECGSAQEIGD